MKPDFEQIDNILSSAFDSGRFSLYEFEVFEVLTALGLGNPPHCHVLKSPDESLEFLNEIPADRLVIKIIHPRIAHKTEVGGVRIVDRSNVDKTITDIFSTAPVKQADILVKQGEIPEEYAELSPDDITRKIVSETFGVLVYGYIEAPGTFGSELFLGMRDTREFGPVINCGLGGVDTELYAKEFRPKRAGITISPGVSDDRDFFNTFTRTAAFSVITGIARGHDRLVEDEIIRDALAKFHAFIWRYSELNPDAPFLLTECEINPLLASVGNLIPVDGLLRFRPTVTKEPLPPIHKLKNLLEPSSILVVGVSSKSMNIGRVILRNLLKGSFNPGNLAVLKKGDDEIDGVKCYGSIEDLPVKYDLAVLSVPAEQVPGMVGEMIEHDRAESIILITGGMGEKEGSGNLEEELSRVILEGRKHPDGGPVMVGGNSLGVISVPGGYDTMFVPPSKLPKNPDHPLGKKTALLSQSGAFMISRMSKLGGFLPRYAVSTGNQVDLGLADFLEYAAGDENVKVFGCYAEGFRPGEGRRFASAASKIVGDSGDVVIYKAGRSSEGRRAASGHTAAIAGDWDVAESVLSRAGCMVAHSFEEWQDLVMLSASLCGRPPGKGRLAAISNAGYETVGIADNLRCDRHAITMADITNETLDRIAEILKKFRLYELVNIRNPIDVTPMAVDAAHVEICKAMANDPNVDIILHACVPLSPAMKTREPGGPDGDGISDPGSFPQLLIKAYKDEITKPLIAVVDSGSLYNPMAEMLTEAGIPVFRSADRAARAVGRWMNVKVKK